MPLQINRTFTIDKTEVAQQNMMKQIVDAGWGDKRYLGMWGKLLKQNREQTGFHPDHLEILIKKAKKLEADKGYSARGMVRKALEQASWRKWL